MPIVKLYSDPGWGSSNTTTDGVVARIASAENFSQIKYGSGTYSKTTDILYTGVSLQSDNNITNTFEALFRSIFTFDTRLGNVTINSAKFGIKGTFTRLGLGDTNLVLTASDPLIEHSLGNSDYSTAISFLASSYQPLLSTLPLNTYVEIPIDQPGIVRLDRPTALSLSLGWDYNGVFSGNYVIGEITYFNFYFADDSNINNRPYLEIDYTSNAIIIPIIIDLNTSSNINQKGIRFTPASSESDSLSNTILDTKKYGLLHSDIVSNSNIALLDKVVKKIITTVNSASDVGTIPYKTLRNVFLDTDTISGLVASVDKLSSVSVTMHTPSSVTANNEIFSIMRMFLDSLSGLDANPVIGKLSEMGINSLSDMYSFIKNIPVDFLLNINSYSGGRWSFIEPVLATVDINSTSSSVMDLIYGLISAALNWNNHLGEEITNHLDDTIWLHEFGLQSLHTTLGSKSGWNANIGWVTLIEMSLDSNSDVHLTFAKLKRVHTDIDSISNIDLNSKVLKKIFTDIISDSSMQKYLIKQVFGTTDVSSLTGVEEFIKSNRFIELDISILSDVDLVIKGLRKILLDCNSLSEVITTILPVRKLSMQLSSDSEIILDILNSISLVLGVDTVSDILPTLKGVMQGSVSIDTISKLDAYLRSIALPFPTIIARFSRKFLADADSLVNSAVGVNFNIKQLRRLLWTNSYDFGMTNHFNVKLEFLKKIV